MISLLVDLTAFFVQASRFNSDRTAFPDTSLLLLSGIFLCCDLYYVVWIAASAHKFPGYLQKYVLYCLVGTFASATEALNEKLKKETEKFGNETQQKLEKAEVK
jgi:hypothetical protein